MRLVDGRYLFGRVILTLGPMENVVLIHVYGPRETKHPRRKERLPRNLLVAPLLTNRLPWVKGYFETVAHWPIDERGNELPGPSPYVGEWGLQSYRTIDDPVSDALGIERTD